MTDDLGDCPYFAVYAGLPWAEKGAVCAYGCHDEPQCVTCEPDGGWPSVHKEINAREFRGDMSDTTKAMSDLRALAEKATPGEWYWGGWKGQSIDLMSRAEGRPLVMGGERLGMRGAQPTFAVGRSPKPDEAWKTGRMEKANDIATTVADHRTDIASIDAPDARWIAAASPDAILALLDDLDGLRSIVNDLYEIEVQIDAAREADDAYELESLKEQREDRLGHLVEYKKGQP